MNQFTSHLDFSLTKKRLLMMERRFYRFRSVLLYSLLLPFLMILGLTFCTTSNSDPFINRDVNIHSVFANKKWIFVDEHGDAYSGACTSTRKDDGSLFMTEIFENGKTIQVKYYSREGALTTEHHKRSYDGATKVSFTSYYENGNKLKEKWEAQHIAPEFGFEREWFENGQLKSELYRNLDEHLEGLVSLYDENGVLLAQERYENGELMEKIK